MILMKIPRYIETPYNNIHNQRVDFKIYTNLIFFLSIQYVSYTIIVLNDSR